MKVRWKFQSGKIVYYQLYYPESAGSFMLPIPTLEKAAAAERKVKQVQFDPSKVLQVDCSLNSPRHINDGSFISVTKQYKKFQGFNKSKQGSSQNDKSMMSLKFLTGKSIHQGLASPKQATTPTNILDITRRRSRRGSACQQIALTTKTTVQEIIHLVESKKTSKNQKGSTKGFKFVKKNYPDQQSFYPHTARDRMQQQQSISSINNCRNQPIITTPYQSREVSFHEACHQCQNKQLRLDRLKTKFAQLFQICFTMRSEQQRLKFELQRYRRETLEMYKIYKSEPLPIPASTPVLKISAQECMPPILTNLDTSRLSNSRAFIIDNELEQLMNEFEQITNKLDYSILNDAPRIRRPAKVGRIKKNIGLKTEVSQAFKQDNKVKFTPNKNVVSLDKNCEGNTEYATGQQWQYQEKGKKWSTLSTNATAPNSVEAMNE